MGNVGPLEVVVVAIIALVVFGPKRVPELGRSAGKAIREFREAVSGVAEDATKEPEPTEPAQLPPSGEVTAVPPPGETVTAKTEPPE